MLIEVEGLIVSRPECLIPRVGALTPYAYRYKDPSYGAIIETAQQSITAAAENMKNIGAAATEIAKSYPVGE